MRSAYTTALEGFALPYGDVAVGGWRNTPYVVIQNVGAYLDTPRFLDTDHPIETQADAEAYLARLQRHIRTQLDGELERMRAARAQGLVPPDFLLDKALDQRWRSTMKDTRERRQPRRIASTAGPRRRTSPATGRPGPARSPSSRCFPRSSGRSTSSRPQRAVATDDAGHVGAPAWRRILSLGAQGLDHDQP